MNSSARLRGRGFQRNHHPLGCQHFWPKRTTHNVNLPSYHFRIARKIIICNPKMIICNPKMIVCKQVHLPKTGWACKIIFCQRCCLSWVDSQTVNLPKNWCVTKRIVSQHDTLPKNQTLTPYQMANNSLPKGSGKFEEPPVYLVWIWVPTWSTLSLVVRNIASWLKLVWNW